MEQSPNGELAERIEEALRKAKELQDEDLQAAFRRARASPDDTRLLLPLLQLPQNDPGDAAGAAAQPDEQIVERKFMCPELYRAAFSGSAQQVQDLLAPSDTTAGPTDEQGRAHQGKCSLDEVTAGWNTVLHVAAGKGHVPLVQQLFQDHTAAATTLLPSVNSKSETALHRAARAGHPKMVSLLIRLAQEHGAGAAALVLARKRSGGDTALHLAARHGHEAVVQVLMVVAPVLSCAVNDARMSPLYLAVMSRSVGAVKALIQWRHASASGHKGQNALHAAVLQSAEITSQLLSWPENQNLAKEIDESKSTPLHYAASDGDREIVGMLIRSMPSATYLQDKEGFTPLHIAAWMGHVDVIHDMLEACPDSAELTDKEGRNFLHVAIHRSHEPVVTYLLGSPILAGILNEQDNDGNTPLHLAVMAGNPNLAILDNGDIELNIANKEGETPFDLAKGITSFLFMIGFVLRLSAHGARFGAERQDGITPWKSKAIKEWHEKTSKNLGIVAVLIATVALSAMFNVPGGYDSNGVANLHATVPYNAFLVLDTVAVAASVIATMLLTYGRGAPRSSAAWICLALIFLWIALMSMILAFMAAVVSGLDSTTTKGMIWGIFALPFAFLIALSFVWAVPAPTFTSVCLLLRALTGEDRQRMKRHIDRRFPLVGFYLLVMYLFWLLNAVAFCLTVYVIINTI
ncbi:uncharacterized protein LOC133897149 [Phragmites australis]|uniref:uncharacterized protein LOC133897149 n=1 Tax=Phragmites australis TaxID=29695 RepID=UPI002D765235|nr:uncharacterized protein LOC133897149 [Phragmites australis]